MLGLGSNRTYNGKKPLELLAEACTALSSVIENVVCSSVYKTGAMYVTEQNDFYNMVVLGRYGKDAHRLLEEIHVIESGLGRDRAKEFRNGPRPLDIDIELFGNRQIESEDLVVPHERLTERAFVLIPLLEILRESADDRNREDTFPQHAFPDGCSVTDRVEFVRMMYGRYEPFADLVKDQKIEKILDSASFAAMLG